MTPVILASASATRRTMLMNAGLTVTVRPAALDEGEIKERLSRERATVADAALALAGAKARLVSESSSGHLVIGADQILECDSRWFDKPEDIAGARNQLKALRGKTHRLVSGVVVMRNGTGLWRFVDTAKLTMRAFSDAFLDRYLDRAGDALTASVGAYRLEDLGAQLFSAIEGDIFTILGLPLLPLLDFLRTEGVIET